MKIMRTIWGDDPDKKQGSSKVAERLASLLAADHTKLSAIVDEEPSPAESFETPSAQPRPVPPPPRVPASPPDPAHAPATPVAGAADTIARATHEAIEKLQGLQQEIEASFRNRTEEHQRTLLKLASNALQRSGFQQRVIKTAADELEETVKGHLARAARQMREQAEAAQASLKEQLRAAHDAFLAQARELSRSVAAAPAQAAAGPGEAEKAAQAALATITQATEQAVARLAAAQKEIEEKFQGRASEFEKRMIEAAAEELGRKGLSTKLAQQAMKDLECAAKESAERSAREIREQAEGLLGQLRGSNQTLLEEARERLAAATRPMIDEQVGAARREVETARDSLVRAVEQALEKLGATRKEIEAGFEARAREEQKRLVEAAAEESARQGASGKLVEQTTAELERAARELLIRSTQELRRQTESARAALDDELRAARESILAEVRQQLSTVALPGASEAAIASVRRAAEEAATRLDAAQKDGEANLRKRAEEFEKRLVEAATAELGRKGLSTRLLEQATKELEQSAKESAERSGREIREQAEGLLGQLRGSNHALLEETRREAEAGRDSLARTVEQAVARLAAAQKELEAGFETRAREEQKRLVEAAAEELGRKGVPEQVTQQAKAEIERAAHEFIAESAEQLRRQAEMARGSMDEELRANRESFLAEARVELAQAAQPARQQAEAAAHSITEAAEQALTRLAATQKEIEARFKNQSEQYQKRLVEAATEELERQGVSDRLIQQASKDLERSAGELLVRAAGELRRQAETARSALDEQLRVSRESFVIEVRQRLASAAQPTIEQHVEAVRQNAQAAVLSLTQASQQAMAGLTVAQRELELNFRAEAKQHQQRLVEGAAEELKRQGISQQIIGDAIAQLEQATREFVDRSSQELRQQAVATLGAVEQQLRAKTDTLIADTHEEIANLIRKPREILQQMLNDALARVVDQLRAEQAELIRKEQAPLRRQLVYLDALTQEERQRAGGGRPGFSGRELRGAGLLAGVAIFAMVMVGWAAYFASRPVMQFRTDAPAGFVEENPGWTAQRQARELVLARAYWTAGLRDVQTNDYNFGAPLPNDPPPDFSVNDKTLPDNARARGRYWSKFRQYWTDPESWQAESSSRVQWIQDSANWLVATLKRVPWSSTIQYNLTKLMNKFQLWWFSHGGDI
jgi:hypothetical protein